MDPRLWRLLNTEPGELYILDVHVLHAGSTLEIECEAKNSVYPNGKIYRITFKNCRDIHWQAMNPDNDNEVAQALGIYLGEQQHNKPAVVYTGETEMSVLYSEIMVQAS